MRTYTWMDQESGKLVTVNRKIEDYRNPPTYCEVGINPCDSRKFDWIKLVDAAMITGKLQKGKYGR
ncbi:MAG: hypothetical protein CMP10_03160 [Zetaproteobacteria bacterium]|nr:hypothetical protein [Pseudobdellovibrionaceae bacterium]